MAYIAKLPVRHRVNYPKQNNPKGFATHHTGGIDSDPLADTSHHTAEGVRRWHLTKTETKSSWDDIGYHVIFEKESEQYPDGRVVLGRPFDHHGAHVQARNFDSIGGCFAGNFDATLPTEKQIENFVAFYCGIPQNVYIFSNNKKNETEKYKMKKNLLTLYPHITPDTFFPHRKFAVKTCHGELLSDTFFADILQEALEKDNSETPDAINDNSLVQCRAIIEEKKEEIKQLNSLVGLLIQFIKNFFNA